MEATGKSNAESPKANYIRLRVEVYDALAARKGLTSVTAQAKKHGIDRTNMSLIRAGRKGVSLPLAMRMAADLDTTVEALFGRVTA
jgi:DNA-binding XRE family transcriptional regulator